MFKRGIIEDIRHFPCSYICRINTVKMSILPKIYIIKVILIKISMSYFIEMFSWKKIMQEFIWNHKRPQITKEVLRGKSNTEGISTPGLTFYSSEEDSLANETGRPMESYRGPRNKTQSYSHLIFYKGAKTVLGKSLFNKWS